MIIPSPTLSLDKTPLSDLVDAAYAVYCYFLEQALVAFLEADSSLLGNSFLDVGHYSRTFLSAVEGP